MFKLNFSKFIIVIALYHFITPTSTFAQSPPDSVVDKKFYFDEIVIQDNRMQIPFSQKNRDVLILDAKIIEALPVQSLNELLGYVSGIDIRQRGPWGGQTDISINGGTFDQSLILLNGIKIIDPQTGHNMMNLPVNIAAIERVEILKGAAASAYGINAIKGALNIITKQPDKNSVFINLTSGSSFERNGDSNKLYGATGADISASLASKKINHFLALSTQQTSGYRYNTAMSNNKAFYQNEIRLDDSSHLKITGGFVHNDFGANGFYSPPGDKESKEKIETSIASVKGVFRIQNGWKLHPSISYRYNHDNYIFIKQNPSVYENNHFSHVLDASLNNSIQIGSGILGVGAEFRKELIRSNSLGNRERDNYGFFVDYLFKQIGNLDLNAGTYLNYSKHFGWQLLPSLDAGYQLTSSWRVYANAGTGTRVPTYTDWYYLGPDNIGNSELEPEEALHFEGGIRFNGSGLKASANYFYSYTYNMIDWVRNSLIDPWQPQNFQKMKMHGISLNADYRLINSSTKSGFNLFYGASYTWLNPNLVAKGNSTYNYSHYALENLKNQMVMRVTSMFYGKFSATLAGRHEQRINYKGYFLTDSKLEANFNNIRLNLNLNNLTNVTYIETGAVPLPGRWLSVGVSWSL